MHAQVILRLQKYKHYETEKLSTNLIYLRELFFDQCATLQLWRFAGKLYFDFTLWHFCSA